MAVAPHVRSPAATQALPIVAALPQPARHLEALAEAVPAAHPAAAASAAEEELAPAAVAVAAAVQVASAALADKTTDYRNDTQHQS